MREFFPKRMNFSIFLMASSFPGNTAFDRQGITCTIRRSVRAKRIRLRISREGEVSLTIPKRVPLWMAELFLRSKAEWVRKTVREAATHLPNSVFPHGKDAYEEHRDRALVLVTERVEYYNHLYGFPYGRITIRAQKTRWGSCSKKGNLSFNWKLAFLPSDMVDYVVVHELCHLKYFDHGKLFWELVEKGVPDYKSIRKRMKEL